MNRRLAKMGYLMVGLLYVFTGLYGGESPVTAPDEGKSLLQQSLTDGQAIVWYLGHCGYAVKTKAHLLVFDYVPFLRNGVSSTIPPAVPSLGNGWIDPQEIRDQDVVVFVSHSHSDHYDAVIDSWVTQIPKIRYIYGWSEKSDLKHFSLPAPRAELKQADLEIITVNSHHSGVPEAAFLVKTDGLVLFHEGDYIGRMSENGPWLVTGDMNYLLSKTDRIDIVFVGAGVFYPIPEIIKSLSPKVIFPMHYGNREEKYQPFPAALKEKGIAIPVQVPSHRGQYFLYRVGQE